jgi:hypothetical protein
MNRVLVLGVGFRLDTDVSAVTCASRDKVSYQSRESKSRKVEKRELKS